MRRCTLVLAVIVSSAWIVLASARGADEKDAKPVGPAEAAKLVDKKVVLEMEIQSIGKGNGVFFLNSEKDYKTAQNFTVFINKTAVQKFQEAKVEDLAAHFKGKTVRVRGTVKQYRDKPEIVVEDPKQIEIVVKKPEGAAKP